MIPSSRRFWYWRVWTSSSSTSRFLRRLARSSSVSLWRAACDGGALLFQVALETGRPGLEALRLRFELRTLAIRALEFEKQLDLFVHVCPLSDGIIVPL